MPNRVLRDYTLSDKINALSWQAECLFVRLMMKADDFGSFHANVKILKASCFPLRDTVRDADISRWLDELQTSGLIALYTHAEKAYLRILDFRQRLQNMRNKFPDPPELTVIHGDSPPETEEKPKPETEEKPPPPPKDYASQLKGDTLYYEQLGIAWNVPKDGYHRMIDTFCLSLLSGSKKHKDYSDFKSHFFNWGVKRFIEYQVQKSQKKMVE